MNSSRPSASLSQLNTPLNGTGNAPASVTPALLGPEASIALRRRPAETNPLAPSSQTSVSPQPPPPPPGVLPAPRLPVPNAAVSIPPLAAPSSIGNSSAADVVEHLVNEFVAQCRVSPVDTSVAPLSVAGLAQIAQLGDWAGVVELSGKLVGPEDYSRGVHDELSLLLQLRFEAFFQLKSFDDLSVEISNVLMHLDVASKESTLSSDNRLRVYSKAVSLSSLVCEIKAMTGRGAEALEVLYRMKTELMALCRHSRRNNNIEYLMYFWWYVRLWNLIVNVLLRQRQFQLALQELSAMLLELRLQHQEQHGVEEPSGMIWKAEAVLLCRIVRLLLQVGGVTEAKKFASKARQLVSTNTPSVLSSSSDPDAEASHVMDDSESVVHGHVDLAEAFLAHVECRYEDAVNLFERVVSRYRSASKKLSMTGGAAADPAAASLRGSAQPLLPGLLNQLRLGSVPPRSGAVETIVWNTCFAALENEGGLYAAATNGMATSLLFLRRIEESIALLEALIQSGPSKYMTDAVVFNLCTMYDLSCAHELSGCKKRMLQGVANKYRICNLNWKSFRL